MYRVYVWTNAINGKRYVGTTGVSMEKRAGKGGSQYKGSPYFYSAIQKYGFDNFSYVILAENLTKDEAAELEKKYIHDFDTMNPEVGYNLQVGGFPETTPESNKARAQKISDTLKAQRASPEYRYEMHKRMQKVWDDPVRHAEILEKRKGKAHGGKPQVAVFCEETGLVYPSIQAAADAFGLNKASVARALSGDSRKGVVGKRKGTAYHIHKILGAQ